MTCSSLGLPLIFSTARYYRLKSWNGKYSGKIKPVLSGSGKGPGNFPSERSELRAVLSREQFCWVLLTSKRIFFHCPFCGKKKMVNKGGTTAAPAKHPV